MADTVRAWLSARPFASWSAALIEGEPGIGKSVLIREVCAAATAAEELYLSPRTVGTHVPHILAKLDLNSRSDLVREAARRA